MAFLTAMECLLQEAGYSRRRAGQLSRLLDSAQIPGMCADDLYAALTLWQRKFRIDNENLSEIFREPQVFRRASRSLNTVCEAVRVATSAQLHLFVDRKEMQDVRSAIVI